MDMVTNVITLTRDFESAEQEANHTQAINLVINRTSDIDTKITQLKLQEPINHHNREKITTTDTHSNRTVSNSNNPREPIPTTKEDHRPKSKKPIPATKILAKHGISISHTSKSTTPICTTSPVYSTTAPELLSTITNNTSNPLLSNSSLQNPNNNQTQTSIPTGYPNQASYLSFTEDQSLDKSTPVGGRDVKQISQPSKQIKNNIPPATITEDTTLATIFPFDINNLNTYSLFNGAAINQDKPIMVLYTDAKVRRVNIKLILDSGSASSIIMKQLMDQLGRRVDHTATT
ncbi:hypothetical protein G9A89_013190 [Geosiphon pyriformis]|nr:hypothetical protein G9A89_013190 [Geosiphon pyriformis]